MSKEQYTREIIAKVETIQGKRSRLVVEHILKHGSITTENLKNYGYEHPPRAIKDVRDQGLPLEMFWTKDSTGKRIAGYRFGDPSKIRHDRLGGRVVFSKKFKSEVIHANTSKCSICNTKFEVRYFQVDHRIPYEILGDKDDDVRDVADYMPLCGSCNRAKSWSCEHCENWQQHKDPKTCMSCYWADPTHYTHVAMKEVRRLALLWEEAEVSEYDALSSRAVNQDETLPEFVKSVLRAHLKQGKRG